MSFLNYLLPVIVLFPIFINRLANYFPAARLSLIRFIGPAVLVALAVISYYNGVVFKYTLLGPAPYFSIGLRLDVLSALIGATGYTIGIIVSRFSVRYLEDDPRKKVFWRNLSYTLSFILVMLMASNLLMLFFAWVGASYYLHELLTHFSEREGAMKAAGQKFWVSRIGDVFIVSAGVILAMTFGSLEFQVIFDSVEDPLFLLDNYFLINVASVLLVFGAMTKSANFPFHYWLPNTMEAPTPVSALMHAGILNAGGYLVIRMSPLLSTAPLALSILAIVGGVTAFWATIIMFTQTSIKKNLAYSTIAQMGFMMLQCGLGAFSVASVHIIGHAFYKSYAFLSSASATDIGRVKRYFTASQHEHGLWDPFFVGTICLAGVFGVLMSLGYDPLGTPGVSVLLLILSLAIAQIILAGGNRVRSIGAALVIVVLYLSLSALMTDALTGGIIPEQTMTDGPLEFFTVALCSLLFVVLYLMQNYLGKISRTRWGKKLYVKALKGSF